MNIDIRLANYDDAEDASAIVLALNMYAKDPMGGGQALSEFAQANLIAGLQSTPNAFTVLAFVDGKIAGLGNCFQTFSTFKCKPIVNIHDMGVNDGYRGLGLSQKMIAMIEQVAKERGACKITLEVLEGNEVAKNAYLKYGFTGYELDPKMGKAMFWEKPIK
ncbi:GNAT family N-acetyltransferase [Psychrosphaera sp. I2R16]|uniref:GNAT family N-acetyltransferase n=1 Tax=unclassified Psychrosphaera TaxID=2641570 RepID=UPI0034CDF6B4